MLVRACLALLRVAGSGRWEFAPFTPERKAQEPGDFYSDTSKIRRLVGWEPRTSLEEGQTVMRALRGRFSGLCQPTYVLDIPDGHGKVPVGPNYVADGVVEDPNGQGHAYPPSPAA